MDAFGTDPLDKDPQDIVTERAFRVNPALLGAALARPRRRAAALALDGVLVAILANAPAVIFGMATAFVLLRAVARPVTGGLVRRSVRRMTRFTVAAILFFVSISLWGTLRDLGSSDSPSVDEGQVAITGISSIVAGADALAILRSTNETDTRRRFQRLTGQLRSAGVAEADIVAMLTELPEAAPDRPWVRIAADSVLAEVRAAGGAADPVEEQEEVDRLLESFASALGSDDAAGAESLRPQLTAALASDTIAELQADLRASEARVAELRGSLAEAREGGGILATFRGLLDDLGLGFGWTGLYFTAFLVLWRGQTPGKRLLRLRVVRLDNSPLGWWGAFTRFGGYAAGLATGLLGFLQIFWDHNRQAIHDKIAGTVVVQD